MIDYGSVKTGDDGLYIFPPVAPANCRVKVDPKSLPGNLIQVRDPDSTLDSQTDAEILIDSIWGEQMFGYVEADTSVSLTKTVNGEHTPTGTGPEVAQGSAVAWSYEVTNTGALALSNVVVSDDDSSLAIDCGDGTNVIASLAAGASATCTATSAAVVGQYTGVGTVTATPDCAYCVRTVDVTAEDTAHYVGIANKVRPPKHKTKPGHHVTPGRPGPHKVPKGRR